MATSNIRITPQASGFIMIVKPEHNSFMVSTLAKRYETKHGKHLLGITVKK